MAFVKVGSGVTAAAVTVTPGQTGLTGDVTLTPAGSSLSDIKARIAYYEALLPVAKSISFPEAERRAGEFLSALATITNWRHLFSEEKIRLLSVQNAVYAEELFKGTAKTMTENKVIAEASEGYRNAREALERMDNDIAYLKAYFEIFTSAHVFNRQMARGENA